MPVTAGSAKGRCFPLRARLTARAMPSDVDRVPFWFASLRAYDRSDLIIKGRPRKAGAWSTASLARPRERLQSCQPRGSLNTQRRDSTLALKAQSHPATLA
jgi:hypothetical protein